MNTQTAKPVLTETANAWNVKRIELRELVSKLNTSYSGVFSMTKGLEWGNVYEGLGDLKAYFAKVEADAKRIQDLSVELEALEVLGANKEFQSYELAYWEWQKSL